MFYVNHVTFYTYFMAKPASFARFLAYVFKCMFYMTVFHIYGSMEIIKKE
jgi:hypothetical protein